MRDAADAERGYGMKTLIGVFAAAGFATGTIAAEIWRDDRKVLACSQTKLGPSDTLAAVREDYRAVLTAEREDCIVTNS